jgi:osmotically-inducible protein OsmY
MEKKEETGMKTDTQVQHDVRDALGWEPRVHETDISVSVHEGVVTLAGSVSHLAEKKIAEETAKRVYGVHAVADELAVRLPEEGQWTDSEIAQAAVHALEWYAFVPHERIQLTVSNAWVTLEGEVDAPYETMAAEEAICHLVGVRGITNAIRLRKQTTQREVQAEIEAAFHRHAGLDTRRIRVETHGNTVVLQGHARSWLEREEAERAAWAAPGVAAVENLIRVTP